MLLPLFLRLEGRVVVVVGGGVVAERKIGELLETGAVVRVVAPRVTSGLEALAREGRVSWTERTFEEPDVEPAWLVYAATDDPAAQRLIAAACEARQKLLVAIDDIPNATAFSASVIRRAPFTIALSSSGEAPALTRLLREVLESALPSERWITRARELRAAWRANRTPMSERFPALLEAFVKDTQIMVPTPSSAGSPRDER
ncbi:MAG: bifunctional precorrin-2 dehydrogenase/sirohydrochlorin ferrochelatase [Polyangiaceae bacterium]